MQAILRDITPPGWYVSMLFDRVKRTEAGKVYSGEGWHRDVADPTKSNIKDGDIVLGGYVNLNSYATHFRCVPDTARLDGFSDGRFDPGMTRINVPSAGDIRDIAVNPGKVILFYQDIKHSIPRTRTPVGGDYRVYVGFRISEHRDPLYDVEDIITGLKAPRLPSGQVARIYPATYPNFFRARLDMWAEHNIRGEYFEKVNGIRRLPHYFKKGLVEMGVDEPEYDYSEDDVNIMIPHQLDDDLIEVSEDDSM